MHRFSLSGAWDLERAVTENASSLLRSVRSSDSQNHAGWEDLTFQFGPSLFLYADARDLVGFASTAAEAEASVRGFAEKYVLPPEPEGGCYSMIRLGNEIERVAVQLAPETLLTDELLALHYGEQALIGHHDFVRYLGGRKHGIAILEGPQGTGKKSYVRHLIGALRGSHRFYFIPVPALPVLSNPCFVGFWMDQRHRFKGKQFALILEDSDALLMAHDAKNREHLNSLLYLTDGLLADFLRLQIICTIHGPASEMDQALLRPGRLISHRIFKRLDREHACRLAAHLGRTLPAAQDYSLAEIFADPEARASALRHDSSSIPPP
ncbi:MAG: hypothetical protein Q8M07_11550 [Prosthecobacter sp.]|nr:hypothetical protein [Prosthecobacter sp.]